MRALLALVAAVVVAVGFGGCGGDGASAGAGGGSTNPRSVSPTRTSGARTSDSGEGGGLRIVAGRVVPGVAFLLGDQVRLPGGEAFRVVPSSVCEGWAVSPHGRDLLVDASGSAARPVLEEAVLRTGRARVVARDACAPAWSSSGRIAYLQYEHIDAVTGTLRGRVVVRAGVGAPARAWTMERSWPLNGRLSWAGNALVISAARSLLALRGPGRSVVIARQTGADGPFFSVVAINPTGTEAVLDEQTFGPARGGLAGRDTAVVVALPTGRVLARLTINRDEQALFRAVNALAPGIWTGDQILTTDAVFDGGSSHPPPVLVVLAAHGRRLTLTSTLTVTTEDGRTLLAQSLPNISQPVVLHRSPESVGLVFSAVGQLRYIACRLSTRSCLAGANLDQENPNGLQLTLLDGAAT